jgi:predicted nucleotidyltransferase
MSTSIELENKLTQLKSLLEQKYNVSRIGYFGSLVRGGQAEHSDVDLLVEFSITPGWEFVDLKLFLEEQLEREVDLVTYGALRPQMRESILNQVRYV